VKRASVGGLAVKMTQGFIVWVFPAAAVGSIGAALLTVGCAARVESIETTNRIL
jgi:hypothetical protein